MKKMIVCGDSFMSPAIDYPGTHFSEIIANHLGYELLAYSRGGMSNGGIAIQIDSAIQEKPDLILVGTTYSDRIEFPINDAISTNKFTVNNIAYHHATSSLSSNADYVGTDPKLISTNLVEIITNNFFTTFDKCEEADEKQKAIKNWAKYLYHPDWKMQVDVWMMYAVLHQLHESGIPYIVCIDPLRITDRCSWFKGIPTVHNINNLIESNRIIDKGSNILYHTSFDTQIQIAEYLLSYMKENYYV